MPSRETQSQESTSKFDGIEDALDIQSDIVPVDKPEVVTPVDTTSTKEQLKKDYEYTRGHLYSLVEKGQEAVDGILELAQESDQPRAYEVAGQLIKSVSDATDKLMDLQKKLKDVNEEQQQKGPNTVNNALFVGSTADLTKLLKNGVPKEDK